MIIGACLGVVIGLCLFILPMWAYRRGIQDGITLSEGKTPPPIKTPIQAVVERVERRKGEVKSQHEQDKISQGLMNILSYDGTPQKEGEA